MLRHPSDQTLSLIERLQYLICFGNRDGQKRHALQVPYLLSLTSRDGRERAMALRPAFHRHGALESVRKR
ncbi:hypothetical protein CYMTET_33307 [Cymbomonas tetramitiformis]|uniref:Uncharacterized protein n=1 Tax=Cymbomonas tetramitiformis TaxID=36881 RepID=A0AAE0FDD4_9CHLO|nr:hypothetical protein CYMTET_33307 [Cymbomonas tetramitiformis]